MNEKTITTRIKEVTIITMAGARVRIVKRARISKVNETSEGCVDVPTPTVIFGIGNLTGAENSTPVFRITKSIKNINITRFTFPSRKMCFRRNIKICYFKF